MTFLICVRMRERRPILCLRVFSACRARFRADLIFATLLRVLRSKSRVLFVPRQGLSMTIRQASRSTDT